MRALTGVGNSVTLPADWEPDPLPLGCDPLADGPSPVKGVDPHPVTAPRTRIIKATTMKAWTMLRPFTRRFFLRYTWASSLREVWQPSHAFKTRCFIKLFL